MPLVHATSRIGAWVIPITLGYFVFDLALLPIWEGKFMVRTTTHGKRLKGLGSLMLLLMMVVVLMVLIGSNGSL